MRFYVTKAKRDSTVPVMNEALTLRGALLSKLGEMHRVYT